MTQEDRDLYLKDLCARLTYGVKVTWDGLYPITLTPSIYAELWKEKRDQNIPKVYLRPMSSMTEEEQQKYYDLTHQEDDDIWAKCLFDKMVDFCNEKHLDYRGLIEKGLALEAPEGMYK